MRRSERYVWPTIAAIVVVTILAGLSVGCAGLSKPAVNALSPSVIGHMG